MSASSVTANNSVVTQTNASASTATVRARCTCSVLNALPYALSCVLPLSVLATVAASSPNVLT
jgi:hypothetical protein